MRQGPPGLRRGLELRDGRSSRRPGLAASGGHARPGVAFMGLSDVQGGCARNQGAPLGGGAPGGSRCGRRQGSGGSQRGALSSSSSGGSCSGSIESGGSSGGGFGGWNISIINEVGSRVEAVKHAGRWTRSG